MQINVRVTVLTARHLAAPLLKRGRHEPRDYRHRPDSDRHGDECPNAVGRDATRSIKALSEQQVSDLGAGRGMGLALAAELNGYPGPSHVLELADKLGLSADQRACIQRLFDTMGDLLTCRMASNGFTAVRAGTVLQSNFIRYQADS
jgi:hypothetical protein